MRKIGRRNQTTEMTVDVSKPTQGRDMHRRELVRIVFAGHIARNEVADVLAGRPDVKLTAVEHVADTVPLLENADVLMLPDPRGSEGLALATALRDDNCPVRWVQIMSAGYDGLMAHDLPSWLSVTNQGGAVAPAVADHAVAMILAFTRNILHIADRAKRHAWEHEFPTPVTTLEDKTIAVVGFGYVGKQVAIRCKAFGARIVGVSRTGAPEPLADAMYPLVQLNQALAQASVAVLTIAMSRETRQLFGAEQFAACKPGAIFVNVSRGETVDQAALHQYLSNGHLGAAAIDVTEPEPLPADDPLWSAPNLLISPHTAGAGRANARRMIASVVAENLERFIARKPLINQVTREEKR